MLSRYLGAVVIGALISAWLATVAYGVFFVRGADAVAAGVGNDTTTYRDLFDEADQQRLVQLQFPRGRVFRAVQESWNEGRSTRPLPNGLISPPAQASSIARPAPAGAPRRGLGPRR